MKINNLDLKRRQTGLLPKIFKLQLAAVLALAAGAVATSCSEVCGRVDKEAQEILAEHQTCEPGSRCKVVSYQELLGKSCIPGFQCYGAFPENADLSSFVQRVKVLEGVQQHCGQCVEALCLGIELFEATCNPETRRCELNEVEADSGGG